MPEQLRPLWLALLFLQRQRRQWGWDLDPATNQYLRAIQYLRTIVATISKLGSASFPAIRLRGVPRQEP